MQGMTAPASPRGRMASPGVQESLAGGPLVFEKVF